jgi:hypothetical protein
VEHVFQKGVSELIGISASPESTSIYLNGERARTSSSFGLSSLDFRGQILIGNSPLENQTWGGLLKGLALYNRALTAKEMRGMYERWKVGDPDGSIKATEPILLFLFNERAGTVIHDQMGTEAQLQIPAHFLTVDQNFLTPFWKEYYGGWGYWKNLAINIVGFVPLGFCFCGYFGIVRGWKRPVLACTLLGLGTSLTIEVLQAFIPMRSSGTTDLITNTLGTFLGAILLSCRPMQNLLSRLGFPGVKERGIAAG